jgi:valyl-tRNA synthetase
LANSRFVDNAPAAVVEQERERLVAHKANVENLQQQIQRLKSMQS